MQAQINCDGRKNRKLKITTFEYERGPGRQWLTSDAARLVEITPRHKVTILGIFA
jgi:hypothetical protein